MRLVLETSQPKSNVQEPILYAQRLSIYVPPPARFASPLASAAPGGNLRAKSRMTRNSVSDDVALASFGGGEALPPPAPLMMKPQAEVLSTGIASTFVIPGLATIPPDNSDHSVQIADLNAPVTFIRTAVPKSSLYVHLKVCIDLT